MRIGVDAWNKERRYFDFSLRWFEPLDVLCVLYVCLFIHHRDTKRSLRYEKSLNGAALFQVLHRAVVGQGFLDAKSSQSGCGVLVPALLHDLRHHVESLAFWERKKLHTHLAVLKSSYSAHKSAILLYFCVEKQTIYELDCWKYAIIWTLKICHNKYKIWNFLFFFTPFKITQRYFKNIALNL